MDVLNLLGEKQFDKLLSNIRKAYKDVCMSRDHYKKLVADWNKDAEIQKIKAQAEDYRDHSLCQLSDVEIQRAKEFRAKHYESCNNGRSYQYELTGTGVGTAITIKCPVCGVEENITDYDCW